MSAEVRTEPLRMAGKRIAYWLNLLEPHPSKDDTFRVCLVTVDEPGYSKMGDEAKGQAPWWWDEETCAQQNARLGNTPQETAEIIGSSMFHDKRLRRRLRNAH